MIARIIRGKIQLWLPPALVLICVMTFGCAAWDRTTKEPQPEADSSWSSQFRGNSKNDDVKQLGLDPRAREIENSLGVH
jgi:hypothetical protein